MVQPPEESTPSLQPTPPSSSDDLLAFIFGLLEALGVSFLILCIAPLLMVLAAQRQEWQMLFLVPLAMILGIGLLQLVYVIPRAIWLYKHGKRSKFNGLLSGAFIILFLNGGCWLLFTLGQG
jgi:hypothetical protein